MECNKDEALRAKKIAEEKLLKNDFEGARKIALKAKQLYPELENISQLITVCDIHCSAQKKIVGAEKDLYGILQVENVADETTIRKQYRKLALVLHPDKNKFPGAEAAFKLIGEANMILSDKGKRSVYDIKCREPARASVTKLQNRQGNQSVYDQNKFNPSSQSNGTNHQQQSTSNPGVRLSFWTYCPFCSVKYEYYREFVNRPLRCQQCSKLFIAYDIGAQRASAGPSSMHEQMQKVNLGSNKVKVGMQKNDQFTSNSARHKTSSAGGVQFAQGTKIEKTEIGGGSRTTSKNNGGVSKPKDNIKKPMETRTPKEVDIDSSGDGVDFKKSSRKRQQASYREEGDGVSSHKKSRMRKSSSDKADVDNADGSMPNGKHKVNVEGVTVDDESDTDSEPVLVDCPDQEFTNFDQDKEVHCFAADQIWACYDSVDGMPRFYAQIRKIYSSSEFRLRFTWLEAEPDNELEIKWVDEELPFACGKFVRGETEETKDRLMFSHQIVYKKGGRRSYFIYPQKGETWALFKDWDIKWSSNPENHKKYKFDIVEILSVHDNFISVAFLLKVKGFQSVFQRTILTGLAERTIPLNEILRFSHRIPSAKLTGTEKAGVPNGSFELDMASLPSDLEEYYCTNEVNNTGSQSRDENVEVKPTTNLENTPKKHMNNGLDNEMLNLRRSPRGLKGGDKVNDGQNPSKFSKSSHDFSLDKQICKFQVGHIWAFWDRNNGIRQCYAEIKQIDESHLHVSLLKLCHITSKNYLHNGCGLFKVSSGKLNVLPLDSFSHIVKAEASGKNMFYIHPKEQQIWALCKKQDGERKSELGECEIVEVLETDEVSIKVMSLIRVPGYKSVFKAPTIERSTENIQVIHRVELQRFFYQIPAFHFTEEKDGSLRGCWELDPTALTGLHLLG